MIIFYAIIIILLITLISFYFKNRGGSLFSGESAVDLLNKRYVRGEISKEEYEKLKSDIAEKSSEE